MLGIGMTKAYAIIKEYNAELEAKGYLNAAVGIGIINIVVSCISLILNCLLYTSRCV